MPIINNFKATNINNAFILGAILQSIIFSFAFIFRDYIDGYTDNNIFKFIIAIPTTFIITIVSLIIMNIIFGFGGGMLTIN